MEIKAFCHPKTHPRPLFLEGRAEVPSKKRGFRGVYNVFQKTKLLPYFSVYFLITFAILAVYAVD